jgi:hypothetical protein
MYVTKEMYGTDRSAISSTQLNKTLYGTQYKGDRYPLYRRHNTGVLRERRGIEYNITRTVNVYSNSTTLYCILEDNQPSEATECVDSSLTRYEYGTTQ